jgi:hypothetical protein
MPGTSAPTVPRRAIELYEQRLTIAREISEALRWATWAWPTPPWASRRKLLPIPKRRSGFLSRLKALMLRRHENS